MRIRHPTRAPQQSGLRPLANWPKPSRRRSGRRRARYSAGPVVVGRVLHREELNRRPHDREGATVLGRPEAVRLHEASDVTAGSGLGLGSGLGSGLGLALGLGLGSGLGFGSGLGLGLGLG